MGGERVTVQGLQVLQVDTENNLLIVNGSIPGAPGTYIIVRKARF
jgi:large subunit ribosomal protein L3